PRFGVFSTNGRLQRTVLPSVGKRCDGCLRICHFSEIGYKSLALVECKLPQHLLYIGRVLYSEVLEPRFQIPRLVTKFCFVSRWHDLKHMIEATPPPDGQIEVAYMFVAMMKTRVPRLWSRASFGSMAVV